MHDLTVVETPANWDRLKAMVLDSVEAKRRALDEIGARQLAADEKRSQELERHREAATISDTNDSLAAAPLQGR